MKVMSTRQFKAEFSTITRKKDEIIVTQRGKPMGLYQPITEEKLRERRISIALRLLSLGKGGKGKASEEHDELIYDK